MRSVHAEDVGDEHEGRAAEDARLRDATLTVAKFSGDGQQNAVAHALAHEALVPTGDDHADADLEGQGAAAVEGVIKVFLRAEDRTIVVAGDGIAGLDLLAIAGVEDLDDELVGGVPSKERMGLRPNSPVTEMFSMMSFLKGFSEAARQSRRMK